MLSDLEGRSFENKDKYNGSGFVAGIKINQSAFYFFSLFFLRYWGSMGEKVGERRRVGNFLNKVLGRFLQNVAVFMKWCDASSVDSLLRSLTIQWWGVGTSQGRWEALSVNTWFAVVYMRP